MSPRRLHTLVVREVRATLRDPFTVITLVTVPLVALLTFSTVLSTDVEHMRMGLYDASQSPASRQIVADLAAVRAFDPIAYPSRPALEAALVSGEIGTALVIPPGFDPAFGREPGGSAAAIQVLYDGAETVLAGNADAFLRSIVGATGARIVQHHVTRPAGGTAAGARPARVEVVTRALFNPRLDGTPFMVAGTFGFVLSFLTVLITAVTIVNERLQGTFDQLQLTPATRLEILLGKLLPLGAVFSLDVVLMLAAAGWVLGVWPAGSIAFFLVVSSFYVVTSLSLGLIFSATSETAAEAVQKVVLFSIPIVQLSGFAFPIRNMPLPVQWLTELIPATHFIRVARAIYLRGAGPAELWGELVILGLFGAALVTIALRTLDRRA